MSFSGYKLFGIYSAYAQGDKLYNEVANEYVEISFNQVRMETDAIDQVQDVNLEEVDKSYQERGSISLSVDFKSLLEKNNDVVAWIYSENTPINYPVVQSHNNDYYLRRTLDRTYNIAGSIFMDYRNSADFSDYNTIIYGHNLRTDTMFGTLQQYSDQKYYEEHPVIYLSTPEEDYAIELISGYRTDIDDDIYLLPQSEEELEDLYYKATKDSNFNANSTFEEGDRLLTLSTCSDYGDDDVRYVLIGKLISI